MPINACCNQRFSILSSFFVGKRSRTNGSVVSGDGRTRPGEGGGKRKGGGLKGTGQSREEANKIQSEHSAYHSGLETLVQKSYTGPRGTKYNVSVDSYLHESAIRIITIRLLRNSRLLAAGPRLGEAKGGRRMKKERENRGENSSLYVTWETRGKKSPVQEGRSECIVFRE